MTLDTLNKDPIKRIDGLADTHSKITPHILEELKILLKVKYGIDPDSEIFDITEEELDKLRWVLNNSSSPKDTLEKFLYDEYIENKLKSQGLNAVTIETVTNGIHSQRINRMKKKFEEEIEPLLNEYDFLSLQTKNIIKLAIANKIINSKIAGNSLQAINSIYSLLNEVTIKSIQNATENMSEINKDSKNNDSIESMISPYIIGLDNIRGKLDSVVPKLTKNEKENIVNNINYFTSPAEIEAGMPSDIISQINIDNKDKKITPSLNNTQLLNLKKYLLNSRENIEKVGKTFNDGDANLEIGLNIVSEGGILGNALGDFIKWILKLPFFGKIIGEYLGLDESDSIGDFDKQKKLYSNFKIIKSFGVAKNEQGEKTSNGSGIFEGIDLRKINYLDIKDELSSLNQLQGDKKAKDFYKKIFSEGIENNGKLIKFEIPNSAKISGELTIHDFKKMINLGLNEINNTKEPKSEVNDTEPKKGNSKHIPTMLANAIEGIKKANGANINDIDGFKLDSSGNNTITIFGTNYLISSSSGAKITGINILGDQVEIKGQKGLFRGKKYIHIDNFTSGIIQLTESGYYKNDSEGIEIKKV